MMLDSQLNVKLLEVNSNPGLYTIQNALLEAVIPNYVESCLKIAVDPFFNPNEDVKEIKFSKIYEKKIVNSQIKPSKF